MNHIIEFSVFVLFFALIVNIIKKNAYFDLFFIILTTVTVLTGEILNLFVYKATIYTDRTGIPLYIIIGGTLIAWTYLKLTQYFAAKIQEYHHCSSVSGGSAKQTDNKKIKPTCGRTKNNLFIEIVLFLFLSILFPIIEIAGIKAKLWYWQKPCPMTSIWWWFGVWKFYMLFLGMPVLTALSLISLKKYLQKRTDVIH